MAETRSQRQRGQRGAGRATPSQGRGRGRAAGQPPSTSINPVRGHSGVLYHTQNLSPNSKIRAAEGLTADFYVDRLHSHEKMDHSDAYYAFQLKKPVSWLFDALNAVLTDQSTPAVRNLTRDGVITEISGLYDRIGERLSSLPELLNGSRGSESDNEEEITARKAAVRDMLSVFDREALPEEYLHNIPDIPADTPIDRLFIPGDLGATIYRLAVRDESIYATLDRILHRDICARYYLMKQLRRARQAMLDLDRYADNGPSSNSLVHDMDVKECGRTLHRIVWEVCQDRESRISKGPLKLETRTMAPEVLIEILEGVCDHNRDIDSENLYAYLISEPPRPATPEERRDFVIDQLRDFPPNEWKHLTERLNGIAEYVRQNAPHGRHWSIEYALKIDDMVNDYVSDADVFEPSSLSVQRQRRPTLSDERESQRPRFD